MGRSPLARIEEMRRERERERACAQFMHPGNQRTLRAGTAWAARPLLPSSPPLPPSPNSALLSPGCTHLGLSTWTLSERCLQRTSPVVYRHAQGGGAWAAAFRTFVFVVKASDMGSVAGREVPEVERREGGYSLCTHPGGGGGGGRWSGGRAKAARQVRHGAAPGWVSRRAAPQGRKTCGRENGGMWSGAGGGGDAEGRGRRALLHNAHR